MASTVGTKKKKVAKCMSCKKRNAVTRGLCASEYQLLQYHVSHGHTTWKEAEKSGACLPPKRQQRPFGESFPMLKKSSASRKK